jgi:sugar lactone lactonase YvrE
MDVKAGKDGLFVAENAEHRVCHFDRNGESLSKWGESARTGVKGFGSCCNPMNVALGPGNVVYTAEDNTGRIKRYSADGKLLGLVGLVELKPGCKNCSIAVSSDGSRVYMLDITRNFIARLDARPATEIAADIDKMKTAPAEASPPAEAGSEETSAKSASASGGFIESLLRVFSSN